MRLDTWDDSVDLSDDKYGSLSSTTGKSTKMEERDLLLTSTNDLLKIFSNAAASADDSYPAVFQQGMLRNLQLLLASNYDVRDNMRDGWTPNS